MMKIGDTIKQTHDLGIRNFVIHALLIADDLGRGIIKHAVHENQPITIDVDNKKLLRLYQLEEAGILKSHFEEKADSYERVFTATPLAKKIAKYMTDKGNHVVP